MKAASKAFLRALEKQRASLAVACSSCGEINGLHGARPPHARWNDDGIVVCSGFQHPTQPTKEPGRAKGGQR